MSKRSGQSTGSKYERLLKQSRSRPSETGMKMTVSVRREQILALEEIQLHVRRRTGERVSKQDLMQEALDMLIKEYLP